MFGSGAKAYSKVSLETDVIHADPHRLVLILLDGALVCIQRAQAAVVQRNVAEKCRYLSRACQIIEEGLKAAVDPGPDPEFAGRLVSLYNYILMRLLQANLRGDVRAMQEAAKHLDGLRSAWIRIGPAPGGGPAAQLPVAAAPIETASAPTRRALNAYRP